MPMSQTRQLAQLVAQLRVSYQKRWLWFTVSPRGGCKQLAALLVAFQQWGVIAHFEPLLQGRNQPVFRVYLRYVSARPAVRL